jgi:DNA-directed RNA polymerase III subunit RPC4
MTASGPFAMGPALAGNNARRSVPRSNFAPVVSPTKPGLLSAENYNHTAASSIKRETYFEAKEKDKEMIGVRDDEVYSDPDEGVEIVDMENVRQMDWMAPESLRKERQTKKIKKEDSLGRPAFTHLWYCRLSIFCRSHR